MVSHSICVMSCLKRVISNEPFTSPALFNLSLLFIYFRSIDNDFLNRKAFAEIIYYKIHTFNKVHISLTLSLFASSSLAGEGSSMLDK